MLVSRFVPAALFGIISLIAAEAPPTAHTVQTVLRSGGEQATVTQYLVALPHLAFGGAWRTKVVITNASSTPANISLYYFGASGLPLVVTVNGLASDHTDIVVPANGQREIEPDWSGPETGGWAGLVYTNAGLKIQGVFLWHNPADPADKYTEAAAPIISQAGGSCIIPLPAAASYTMPFDETEGRFSGYAYTNTTNATVSMTLSFTDESGQVLGTYTQQLAGFGHDQFLIGDKVPGVAGKKGIMKISGSGIVPLGFRFTPYYTFTTWQP